MSFYDAHDEIPQRHPSEMSVLVNTVGAIGHEQFYIPAFLVTHLSNHEQSDPNVLLSLWLRNLTEPSGDNDLLEYTIVMTPQQVRALAFGMLRLADGLEAMVEHGEYGDRQIADLPVYMIEPDL